MNVKLSIEEDAELRAYIKDCIRGQILSITRDEYFQVVKDEVNRKIKDTGDDYFRRIMMEAMRSSIIDLLLKECKVSTWNGKFVYPIATPIIIEAVSHAVQNIDWEGEIKARVRDAVKDLLKVAE